MKVALVYDRVNKWGGAERVLIALHKIFPDAPLYTSVYDRQKAPWAKVFDIRTSFLQKFPFASGNHELYATLMPLAFENFSFDEYDLVISVTSEAAKGIITKPKTLHICYCLTPTRYLWSSYNDYFRNSYLRFFSKPVISYLKTWDKIAAQRPDKFIAISKEVQKRIKKYYKRESIVIYPPLMLSSSGLTHFSGDARRSLLKSQTPLRPLNESRYQRKDSMLNGRYFLIVSRLVPYKRIDIAIKAFNKLKLPLKIIGTGFEEGRLKAMAGSNIEFLSNLTEQELVGYYKDCHALVFPGKEDFGLVILEAQSFGKPVIALGEGGALETIDKDKTGMFFYPQTHEALTKTIKKFMTKKFDPQDSIKQAQKFNIGIFKEQLNREIKLLL